MKEKHFVLFLLILFRFGFIQSELSGKQRIQFYKNATDISYTTEYSTVASETDNKGMTVSTLNPVEAISIATFGVTGNGTTDDTYALSDALNSSSDIYIPDNYIIKVTRTIMVRSGVTKKVIGGNSVKISAFLSSSINLFNLSKSIEFENITFDFNNSYVKYAIFYNAVDLGLIKLNNLIFQNTKDINSTTGMAMIYIPAHGNWYDIDNIIFSNILKRGNGAIGDTGGSLCGIIIHGTAGFYTKGTIRNLHFNELHNINSSDVIIFEDVACVYISTYACDTMNNVKIQNIWGKNFGKRLLKIHASNVSIENVTAESTLGDCLSAIFFMQGEGLGDKYGCSAKNIRVLGMITSAVNSNQSNTIFQGVYIKTIGSIMTRNVFPSCGLSFLGDGTVYENINVTADRGVVIGSSEKTISNSTLRNVTINIRKGALQGVYDQGGGLGFNEFLCSNLVINVLSGSTGKPFDLINLTAENCGKNLTIDRIRINSNGSISSYGINVRWIEGVKINNFSYYNTSGTKHYHLIILDNCSDVAIENTTVIGPASCAINLISCTSALVDGVKAKNVDYHVYNTSSIGVFVTNSIFSKVAGNVIGATKFGTSLNGK